MKKSRSSILFFIFVLALGVRLWNIGHGFPFIFHPDEPSIIRSALGVRFNPNPDHFDWPHLYIYINFFFYMLFAKMRYFVSMEGYKETVAEVFPLIFNDDLIWYLLTRIMSAFFGALTIWPVYLTAKNFGGRRAGILASLFLALTPFHVWHSHYALSDVPMAFLVSWAMYFGTQILLSPHASNYILSGFFVGFATSTKYNGAISSVYLILSHLYFQYVKKPAGLLNPVTYAKPFVAFLVALFAFFLGTPYAFLDYKTFLITDSPKGALWQFQNVGKVTFSEHITQFIDLLIKRLPSDFGWPVFLIFLFSIIYLLWQLVARKRFTSLSFLWIFVIGSLFMIFYVSGFKRLPSHYFLMAYPGVVVSAGLFLDMIYLQFFKKQSIVIICTMILITPLSYSVIKGNLSRGVDTRVILYEYLLKSDKSQMYYYDGRELSQVIDAAKLSSKRVVPSMYLKKSKGVLIIRAGSQEDIAAKESTYGVSSSELLYDISNMGISGPLIRVYKLL